MFLHSAYNPVKEAERFLETRTFSFIPLFIVITEPGESYLAQIIRNKFPDTKIIAVRYTSHLFCDSDYLWDSVWRPETGIDLGKFLFNLISDENLPLTVFLPWKPADTKWPTQAELYWNSIASFIKLQQNVMFTRSHFGKQWLSNMIMNTVRVQTVLQPARIHKPVFLGAAGTSLGNQFPLNQDRFYICSVSSALACFQFHQCPPDLCIATDGGFWAGRLFNGIPESIPVAFPLEAYIPSRVLENNHSIILNYGGLLEKTLMAIAHIQGEDASRNGTVTGTAAQYLLDHSDSYVYVAGLDLESTQSFAHAQPHISDEAGVITTNRLQTLATKLFIANGNTASLDIYASWFASRDETFKKRFIRLKPEGRYLQGISSISLALIQDNPVHETNTKSGFQNIRDHSRIKKDIVDYLELFRSELILCLQNTAKNSKEEEFANNILQNAQFNEAIQMICYTDYLSLTKKIRMIPETVETESLINIICRNVDVFLEKLITRVEKNG